MLRRIGLELDSCRWTWIALVSLALGAVAGCGGNSRPSEQATVNGEPSDLTERPSAEFQRIEATANHQITSKSTATAPSRRRRKKKKFPRNLSEYKLFRGKLADLEPAESVVEYDVNTRSFADYSVRQRVVRLPEGTSAEYRDSAPFAFPVGTVVAKTFYYENDMTNSAAGRRLVETRILLHRDTGWIGLPYVWNDEQTDATLALAGAMVDVSWIHSDGETRSNTHIVANFNDCKRCHKNEILEPIGLKARHLNRDHMFAHGTENQLAYWSRTGMLQGAPDPRDAPRLAVWNDETTGTVEERARAWLEVNCAHCHNPRGPAQNSGLYLWANVMDPYQFGVYKTPVAAGRGAAGRSYDIVPGKPDESILQHRIESTEAGILMPEFGRTVVDEEGVALIRQWIEEMQPPSDLDIENAVGEYQSLSSEELQDFVADVNQLGDAARGEEVFHRKRLNCLKCHSVAGVGRKVGPDLSEPRPDKTLNYLIESLLLPNKEVRKGFETVNVATMHGQVFTGIKLRESDSEIVLRDLTRDEFRIDRSEIDEVSPGLSLMPTNVVALVARQDFLDLVRFLSQLGQPGPFLPVQDTAIRSWEILDPMPLHAGTAEPDQFVAASDSGTLIWEPAYSRMSGELPNSAFPAAANTSRRFVRCHLDVDKTGEVLIDVNSTDGLYMWLDGIPVQVSKRNVLKADPGTHTLTFMIDLDQRSQEALHCEIGEGS